MRQTSSQRDASRAFSDLVVPKEPARQDPTFARAQQLFDEARKAREAKDAAGARDKATEAVDILLAQSANTENENWVALISDLGTFARDTGELQAAERAWRRVLEIRLRTLPDDHPEVQRARGNLAVTLYTLGDLGGAQTLFEKTLDVFSRTLSDDDLDLQLARQGLAATKWALGDLQGARALFEKVLEIRVRTLPDEDPEVQRARQNLAATLSELGDLQGARALFEQVLEIDLRTLPDDHPDLQMARGNLASTMQSLGDLHGARELQTKVLEVRSRALPDDHPDLQLARHSLAMTLHSLGDLQAARALEARVLEIRARTLPDDHPDLQAARLNFARTIGELGDLQGARLLEEQVLDILSRTLPDEHPRLQAARGNLGLTLRLLGDLQGARSQFEKVLDVCSRTLPDRHPSLQAARLNLALTIKQLGELGGARALEEQALDVFSRTLPDDHPDLQAGCTNLALTLRSMGKLEDARVLFEKVLEVSSRTLPDDHPSLQGARGNLALTVGALGDLQGARALFEQVLDVFSRTLPDDHPHLQQTRGVLALTIAGLRAGDAGPEDTSGDDGERRRFADLAGSFTTAVGKTAQAAMLESGAREAEERCSNLLPDVSLALSLATGLGVFAADPDLNRAAFLSSERSRGAAVLSSALARAAGADARYAPLRRTLQEASEGLAQLAQHGAKPDEFAAARVRREAAERELVALARGHVSGAETLFAGDVSSLAATLGEEDAMVVYRRYTRSEIDRAVSREETSTESLCSFVVRSGDRLERIELGPIEPIQEFVARWRRTIGVQRESDVVARLDSRAKGAEAERGLGARPALAEYDAQAAVDLRRVLLDPLRDALQGARRLVVCPDDVVVLVPLDALPIETRGDAEEEHGHALLGDVLRIDTRTTLLEVLLAGRDHAGVGALVVLGDAAFDREPTSESPTATGPAVLAHSPARSAQDAGVLRGSAWEEGFGELSSTRAEVLGIAAHFEQCFGVRVEQHVLAHAEASRESVFALAPRARFLHLATHGWFAPESIKSWSDPEPLDAKSGWGQRLDTEKQVRGMSPMLLCGLALAGANLPASSIGWIPGLVTAEELSTLDLSNCELAVLSACDTNVGVRRAGQGVASLQKALQMAGARSVITSLWRVPDEATKDLMLDFYRRLWVEKKPKWQALWEAKMKIRNAKDEAGRPKYTTRDWAAWVLTGDPI